MGRPRDSGGSEGPFRTGAGLVSSVTIGGWCALVGLGWGAAGLYTLYEEVDGWMRFGWWFNASGVGKDGFWWNHPARSLTAIFCCILVGERRGNEFLVVFSPGVVPEKQGL